MLMDNEEWNIWSTSAFVDSNFGHKYDDNNPILFIVKNFVDKDLITFKKLLLEKSYISSSNMKSLIAIYYFFDENFQKYDLKKKLHLIL